MTAVEYAVQSSLVMRCMIAMKRVFVIERLQ